MRTVLLRSAASGRFSLRRIVPVLAVMMGVLLMAAPMFSQTATGRITGTVKDQTGGSIAGAAVAVTDVARGLTRNLTTDESGSYLAVQLIAGQYTVRATFTGFQAWERTNITLGVGGDVVIDAVLLPGAQTQTVTITEELPLINTTSSALSATLTSQTIADLPVSGRNYAALLDLKPGTVTQLGNENGGGGTTSAVWGVSGDIPVPGDYNGDGKTDYAVWRPSSGTWFVRNIANVQWGISTDAPVGGR